MNRVMSLQHMRCATGCSIVSVGSGDRWGSSCARADALSIHCERGAGKNPARDL